MCTELSWETESMVITYKWQPIHIQPESIIKKKESQRRVAKRGDEREKGKERAGNCCDSVSVREETTKLA